MEFVNDVVPEVARRRVIETFSWIAGFIVLVFLLGFLSQFRSSCSRTSWFKAGSVGCCVRKSNGSDLGVLLLSFPAAPTPPIRGRSDPDLDQTWMGLVQHPREEMKKRSAVVNGS